MDSPSTVLIVATTADRGFAEAAEREPKGRGGRMVDPLGVVDEEHDGSFLRHAAQDGQDGRAHRPGVRWHGRRAAEHRRVEGLALRFGQVVRGRSVIVDDGFEQIRQRHVGEVAFRLGGASHEDREIAAGVRPGERGLPE